MTQFLLGGFEKYCGNLLIAFFKSFLCKESVS